MDVEEKEFDYLSAEDIAQRIFGPDNDPMVDCATLRQRTIFWIKAYQETVAHYIKVEANMFEHISRRIGDPSRAMDLLHMADSLREVATRIATDMAGRTDIHTVAGLMYADQKGRKYTYSRMLRLGKYEVFLRY